MTIDKKSRLVSFIDPEPVFFLAHETPEQSNRNHLKTRLGLEDADFVNNPDFFGGKIYKGEAVDYSVFKFFVPEEAAARLAAQEAPDGASLTVIIPKHENEIGRPPSGDGSGWGHGKDKKSPRPR